MPKFVNLKFFLPTLLIVIILMLIIFQMDKVQGENREKNNIISTNLQIAQLIQNDFSIINSDLMYLAGENEAIAYFQKPSPKKRADLEEHILNFSKNHTNYSQLRYLDLQGQEVVRVNRKGGHSELVAKKDLQNKSDRYYFIEAQDYRVGEIYQSVFDLNVERGVIEKPINPTIRFVTSLQDSQGKKLGYVILNFNATILLQQITKLVTDVSSATDKHFSVMNQQGYYFLSDSPEKNWGFMYDQPDNTLAVKNPKLWEKIQHVIDDEGFEYDGVFYVVHRIYGRTGNGLTGESSTLLNNYAKDMPWIILGQRSLASLSGESGWQAYWVYFIAFLLIIIVLISLGIANRLTKTIQNLTDREWTLLKFNKRFEALIESMPEGILILDKAGCVEVANNAAEEILNLKEAKIKNQPFENMLPGIFTKMQFQTMADYFLNPQKIAIEQDDAFSFERVDGTVVLLEVKIVPVVLGDEVLAIVMLRDVTSIIEHRANMRQVQKMEAIGQLTGGIAHDFNNMLGIAMGNLELLEMNLAGDEKALKRVSKLNNALLGAADLTQKLLSVSRKKALSIETVDLDLLMKDVLQMLYRSVKERIRIHYISEGSLPNVKIDPNELINCLINLAVNARDAMPNGGDIFIKTELVELDEDYTSQLRDEVALGQYVLIEFSDTGSGIPKELIDKVLEPFFTTKEKGKGTGLGLAMIYGFVKQSQGHLRIYSELNKGTSIHIYLPVLLEDEMVVNQPQKQTEIVEKSLEGMKILVVDDEVDLAEVLTEYISFEGVACDVVYSGDDAWLKLQAEPYDLVFSDIVMPGELDGLGLYEKVKQSNMATKVILTSGFSEEMLKKQYGFDPDMTFVRKPYNRSQIKKALYEKLNAFGDVL
ncbi:ATP-binding protein [Thiomicrorhabdus sp.]|uniref:ATP-binding protein n=1 Tax=Thiomicrorhabdus sp. TaxID=2039724 RepID=UPI002AA6630F|nr:ATP-binding protein [Thiomicrorhabdus sp.]